MNKHLRNTSLFFIGCFFAISKIDAANLSPQEELKSLYDLHCSQQSDVRDHVPVLRSLARECSSVVEIGIRNIVSTWGILQGLTENTEESPSYLGIDLKLPPPSSFNKLKRIAEDLGIAFDFWQANDMTIDIPVSDMLFIDSLHTYCHLTYELETFSPQIRKYITIHDTSAPWGNSEDTQYRGNYSEYPQEYDRSKKGLWPAVEDFLAKHSEWSLLERHRNCHGFTILKRVAD